MTAPLTPVARDAGTLSRTRPELWTLATITAAFVAIVAFWAMLTPLYDAPDEPLHMNSAVRLAEGGGWPDPGDAEVTEMILAARGDAALPAEERRTLAELRADNPGYNGVDQMTQHPPLYYAYVAVVLNAVDFLNIRSDHALLAARLAGLLFALPLPFLAWDSVRRITRSARAGLVGAASVIAIPQLAHILGSVSNDSMTIAFASVTIWLGIRVMTGDRSWVTTLSMGLALALALLTKGTAVPLVAYVAVVLIVWPRELTLSQRLLRTAAAMGVGLLGGWWWIRNILVFHALQPAGLVYPAQPWPEGKGPSVLFFADQLWGRVSNSFWGNFGWLNHPLPVVITDIVTAVCLAVVIGYAFRRGPVRWQMVTLAGLTLVFVAALLYQTWPSYVRTQLPAGMQGRYFFVVLIALIVLSAVAWRRLVPAAERTSVVFGLLVAFGLMAAVGVFFEYRYVYAGFSDWLARIPLGAVGGVLLAVLTAALGVAAVVMSIRFARAAAPAQLPAEEHS